jgi:hypothetical protein
MAILMVDGFDHAIGDPAAHLTKYQTGGIIGISTTTERGIGGSLALATLGSVVSRGLPTSDAVAGLGFRTRFTDSDHLADGTVMCAIGNGLNGYTHVYLGLDHAGHLVARKGDGTIYGTSSYALFPYRWFYIEVEALIDGSAGTFIVKVDSVTKLTLTGLNTNNGGANAWDRFSLNGYINGSSVVLFDDLYVRDGFGPAPGNGFLGTSTKLPFVFTGLPKTDAVAAGSNADFVPSTGTDHGALVDENPPDTTTYNSSDTPGDKDSYKYEALPISGDVLAVQLTPFLRQTHAGVRTAKTLVRQGGVDYPHADDFELPTTFEYRTQMYETNPATSAAWTEPEVNNVAAEIGLEVAS